MPNHNKQNLPNVVSLTGGLWGRRTKDSVVQWVMRVSDDLLLNGFKHRPGVQAWIGEHAGKFLDGALLINLLLDDCALWDKIDYIAQGVIDNQEADGYIGTYLPETRWLRNTGEGWEDPNCSWDLWVFKYCVLGLLHYYEIRKDEKALEASRRAIDLLIEVFGENGEKNLNLTDSHGGLASGSVLEAVMKLYGFTGEKRYLDFGKRIVKHYWASDTEGTPYLTERITDPAQLRSIGNGKCYEMMSCFVGLLEYAYYSGEMEYIEQVITVRDNIALYYKQLNGCMSIHEKWGRQYIFSERDFLENCVAFAWIQLNTRLFEMTGDSRCIGYIEETAYNHILVSMCPEASAWEVYTTLTGPKNYVFWSQIPGSDPLFGATKELPHNEAPMTCCHTNGQRVLGLVPHYVYSMQEDVISVNMLFAAEAIFELGSGKKVKLSQQTDFPRSGCSILTITADEPIAIRLRMPSWATTMRVGGRVYSADEPIVLEAQSGETCYNIDVEMKLRLLSPGYVNRGKYGIAYGPLLLAIDSCPDGWCYDEIVLAINKKDIFDNVKLEEENGWPKLTVAAYRVPDGIGELKWSNIPDSLPRAEVYLRPLMFAGLTDNRAFSQRYEDSSLSYHRKQDTAEYRVLYPCFFLY
ncbi:MAG: glycoside hydrolase family 127 protein [Defluviitaleaceae bacterium]|nr:glycoside hydrolase family 127 protein [Defluviitaleaceae bacterium]